ncbi:MAG: hypothetical protein HY663_02060 [Chloroflexi bacterium]|nr:hypothetical protein [Chloroflexota bacterium]
MTNMVKLMITVIGVLTVPVIVVTAVAAADPPTVEQVTTTYSYNAKQETWTKDVMSVSLPQDPEGTQPQEGNTVIIRLDQNNPVKQIVILDALVIGGNASEPRLEIAGHDTGGSGRINIGTLLFKKVDAEKLKIHDTDAVRLQMQNAVAQDNELDIDVDAVNAVRTGRGGPSSLFIGTTRSDLKEFLTIAGIPDIDSLPDNLITKGETGVRVDRIRILGPSSGIAFVERILIVHTSVFGQIEVKDIKAQDIILRDVTVDDSP